MRSDREVKRWGVFLQGLEGIIGSRRLGFAAVGRLSCKRKDTIANSGSLGGTAILFWVYGQLPMLDTVRTAFEDIQGNAIQVGLVQVCSTNTRVSCSL